MKPGDIMRIKHAPDQSAWERSHVGMICLLIRNLGPEDGVVSSPNMWDVLVEGKVIRLHKLDLEKLDETR